MKFCKDCRWSNMDFFYPKTFSKCNNNKVKYYFTDSVTGKTSAAKEYCSIQRSSKFVLLGTCGPEAKYFEPRKTFIERLKEWFK